MRKNNLIRENAFLEHLFRTIPAVHKCAWLATKGVSTKDSWVGEKGPRPEPNKSRNKCHRVSSW